MTTFNDIKKEALEFLENNKQKFQDYYKNKDELNLWTYIDFYINN